MRYCINLSRYIPDTARLFYNHFSDSTTWAIPLNLTDREILADLKVPTFQRYTTTWHYDSGNSDNPSGKPLGWEKLPDVLCRIHSALPPRESTMSDTHTHTLCTVISLRRGRSKCREKHCAHGVLLIRLFLKEPRDGAKLQRVARGEKEREYTDPSTEVRDVTVNIGRPAPISFFEAYSGPQII